MLTFLSGFATSGIMAINGLKTSKILTAKGRANVSHEEMKNKNAAILTAHG